MFAKFEGIAERIQSEGHMPLSGAQGVPLLGAESGHAQGAQGKHVPGAEGSQGIEWRDLTLKQQRVLEWLARYLRGQVKEITCLYRRIGNALGISQRAARVHVEALKKKRLILTEVIYRPNFHQKIGVRISIAEDAPIKHLPHKMSPAEMQEMKIRMKVKEAKDAQMWDLIKKGYILVPELNCYALEPENLRR